MRLITWIVVGCFCSSVWAKTEIITNQNDDRAFDYFVLNNDLKVLLISDDKAVKAAAALDVNVGSSADPKTRPGLAHFLEHMLFLGTEKYPDSGAFQEFVSGHGGDHNAYTSAYHTNYFFDVNADYLQEALDRFSQFFISPLLSEKYVDRERLAIHSEYISKINSASRREKDVIREIVNPAHPLAKFSTGNRDTLNSVPADELRQELKGFYLENYSSSNMVLVVASPHSLEKMKKWVETSFSAVPNYTVKKPQVSVALFNAADMPNSVFIQPKKERRKLAVYFPSPNSKQWPDEKPLAYIGNFLGHEGKGSLLSVLKTKGWARSLSAGLKNRWHDGEMFGVNIYLTEEGYENISVIRALVFDYITLLQKSGLKKWRYNELSLMSRLAFEYGQRGDSISEVSRLASRIHDTPITDLYWQSYNWERFDKKILSQYLQNLNEANSLTLIVSPNVDANKISEFYDTPYRYETFAAFVLSDDQGKLYKSLRKKLRLPKKNVYLPKKFAIKGLAESSDVDVNPSLIFDKNGVRGWHLNDPHFDAPKGYVAARYKLPSVTRSVEEYAALRIYTRLVSDALNVTSYEASLAGLSYGLSASTRGLELDFYGYDSSLPALAKSVLESLVKFQYNKKYRSWLISNYFDGVKEDLLRRQRNRKFDKVYSQVFRNLPATLYSPYWAPEDVEQAIENLDESQFKKVSEYLFDGGEIEAFVYGNFTEKEAKKYFARLSKLSRSDVEAQMPLAKVVDYEDAQTSTQKLTVSSEDSVGLFYMQGNSDSLEERATLMLLEKMIATPIYQELRTEQQLGYIVMSANYLLRDVPGIVTLVQSPTVTPNEIYKRTREFFVTEKKQIIENFSRDKSALISELNEPPKNQSDWANFYWDSILNDDTNFNELERLIETLENLKLDDVIARYDDLFIKSKPHLFYAATKKSVDPVEIESTDIVIDDYKKFKKSMPSYNYQ